MYRALDRHLQREVAVKVLRQELLDSDVKERFQREIRLTSRLEHPYIARVYGTGEFLGSPYFVIALARGTTLGERLRHERQLPIVEAVTIARQVASALQHAHSAGIIHRDVKPENILLTPDGALLSDFGIARALDLAPGTLATTTGTAVGTLLYMSPEQLCAEKDVDARTDQYALALVLYEMLAGVPAHVAANAEGLRGLRIVGQHAPLHTHRPTVPAHVEAAVHEALAPAPADRFTNMNAFIAALDDGQNSASFRISAASRIVHPVPAASPLRRWIAGGAVLAALATAGVMNADRLYLPTVAASMATPAMATSFTVVADGDTAVAAALATELGLWSPEIRAVFAASKDAMEGVVLETRMTAIPGGLLAAVRLRPARSEAAAMPRIVQITLPTAAGPRSDSLRLLAARVLIASRVSPDSIELPDVILEHPIAALRSYGDGWASLLEGDLANAEQSFADAARTRSLPQATLWQATVASWRQPRTPAAWRDVATAAQAGALLLSRRDSLLAEALRHRAADRMPESCDAYTRATRLGGGSFAAWYGLGECLRLDSIVVLDTTSPTGARFRTSRWAAGNAYEEAIARLLSPGQVTLFARLAQITMALNGINRKGVLERAKGTAYSGLPSLSGDSVTVYPQRVAAAELAIPSSYQGAVRLSRRRLLTLGAALVRRAPGSFAARLAYAAALETNGTLVGAGDSTAIAVLRNALLLARSSTDTLDVALAEVRVRLRLGDFEGVPNVVALVLAGATRATPYDVHRLIPLALLTGRVATAESLLVRDLQQPGPDRADGAPTGVATAVARYTIASAAGECEALGDLRFSALDAIVNALARAEVAGASRALLEEGDRMRLSCPNAPMPEGVSPTDALPRAIAALRSGDRASARAALAELRRGRDGASSSAVAWDTRFLELSLLVQSEDSSGARQQIDVALADLSGTMDYVLFSISQPAALRRTLALCDSITSGFTSRPATARCRSALQVLSVIK